MRYAEALRRTLTWHVLVLAAVACLALFARFFHKSFYGFFEDDFFYYALVAKHLVRDHVSSFNGMQLTNGYHPLWLAVVALCYIAFPGTGFFIGIEAVAFVAILVYYLGVQRCLTRLGASASLARVAALVLSLHALLLFRYGMEVTLALPLGVWTVAYVLLPSFVWTPRQSFVYGLLGSMTVLARLDSVLLVTLLIAAQTLTAGVPWRVRGWRLAIFGAGCFPFFAYLGINLRVFGMLLPISGMAKQLKPLWPPTAVPLWSLFLPFDRTKAVFVYPSVVLIAIGGLFFLSRRTVLLLDRRQRGIVLALLLFPILHVGVLCFVSDWAVWPWYFYSFCYAGLAALALVLAFDKHSAFRVLEGALAIAAAVLAVYLTTYAVAKRQPYKILMFVSSFSNEHPGIYAMGDGSGTPAYLSTQAFVQLEGLMMDSGYLHLIWERTPLRRVLLHYHVDYYVVFVLPRSGPCLSVSEPSQGGALSPKLSGRICVPPLASTIENGTEVDVYRASDVELP